VVPRSPQGKRRVKGRYTKGVPYSNKMAEADYVKQFKDWFTQAQAAGQIPAAAVEADWMPKYGVARLENLEGSQKIEARERDHRREAREVEKVVEDRREQRERWARSDNDRATRALREMGRTVSTADGGDPGELRSWIEDMTEAGEVADAKEEEMLRFAVAHSRGSLHKVLYTIVKEDRAMPWERVKEKICSVFLSEYETSTLINIVLGLFQEKGESTAVYCQRYREAVQRAWPSETLASKPDMHAMVLKGFMDSLQDVITMHTVKVGKPKTLEVALGMARESGQGLLTQTRGRAPVGHREEEDMEVGASSVARVAVSEAKIRAEIEMVGLMKSLQGEIKGLRKVVYDNKAPVNPAPAVAVPVAAMPPPQATNTLVVQPPAPAPVNIFPSQGGGDMGADRRNWREPGGHGGGPPQWGYTQGPPPLGYSQGYGQGPHGQGANQGRPRNMACFICGGGDHWKGECPGREEFRKFRHELNVGAPVRGTREAAQSASKN